MDVKEQALTTIRRERMLSPDCAVIAGVSGGADSVVLLHVLHELQQEGLFSHLHVVHVNHNLRGEESLRDQRFVEDLCARWNVPLSVVSHDVAALASRQGKGLEEMGRELRYAAFEEQVARFADSRIATAHTADDNAETLLLHLCRGSGLHGAAGIPPVRGRIIRPLLFCSRQAIEQYCTDHDLVYITDSSNADTYYTRNRIRSDVMPVLRTINPQVTDAFARFIEQARQSDVLLSELTQQAVRNVSTETQGEYDRQRLLQLSPALVSRVLCHVTQTAEEKHVQLLLAALQAGSGSVVLPSGAKWSVTETILSCVTEDIVEPFSFAVRLNEWQDVAGFDYCFERISRAEYEQKLNISKRVFSNALDYDKICGDLFVRQRRDGDGFRPAGRGCSKSLKKVFNEGKAQSRDSIPVLCDEKGIVAVYGFGCDERVRITESTATVLRMIKRGEDV